ncbi:Hypothetical protein GSB_151264 [Giardia duodenalis]|uniref:Uncharacterized protein n=1 Tax=Giardia intestinalis TaxID=5741 RepID=V6TZT5_GIAIN|nr:Hypothetical protein GSB_151264 [Giardia intestinalis]
MAGRCYVARPDAVTIRKGHRGGLWLQCWGAEEGAASRGIGGGWSPAGPGPRAPGRACFMEYKTGQKSRRYWFVVNQNDACL